MGTTTRNEAAERLRAYHDALGRANKVVDAKTLGEVLTEYLAELIAIERRATVERIRERLTTARAYDASEARYFMDEDVEKILDEEAARMSYGGESEARRLGAIGRGEPRALCNRQHDGVNDDGMGYFVVSHDGGAFAPEPCKDCEWVRQLRERRP